MKRSALRRFTLVAGLSLLLAACGGGGGGAAGTGTLRLALTDAPACGFDEVNVTIEKVRIHQSATADDGAAGWSEVVVNPTRRVDLLSLTNGVLSELGQTELPAGKYTQMRLVLAGNTGATPFANSVVPTGGSGEVALTTPSGQQSGLKLNTNIEVIENQLADFVIDFDACKSVVSAGSSGRYLLKPVLSVIPRLVSGVSGFVHASVASGSTTLSLQQAGVAVRATVPDSSGRFLLQPVPPGSYTLVMTAPGRTTLVVNGVTVAGDTVSAISLSAAPLNPPLSPVAAMTGTVSTAVSPIEANVRALQPLTGGPVIEVASRPVDSVTGAYGYQLPTAAALVATYISGGSSLAFTPDGAAAARYSLEASSGSAVKAAGPFSLTAGSTVTTAFVFP